MMRPIELLPESYLLRRSQRRRIGLVVIAGLVVLALLIFFWVSLGVQINDSKDQLAGVQAHNAEVQARIDDLQHFADLQNEVQTKSAALATVMTGDVDWSAMLTEVAMVLPGDVWLTSLTASAGQTEGATPVGTETAPVRITKEQPFGRIEFQGSSLSMPGVGKWLIRLATAKEFGALWLNDATGADSTDATAPGSVVTFDSTLELNDKAASRRYQDGLP